MNNSFSEPARCCHICDGLNFSIRYKNAINGRSILQCKKCGVWGIFPVPSEEEIKKIYKKSYYDSWEYDEKNLEPIRAIKKDLFLSILEKIELYSKPFNLLDIGCAMGFSLEAAAEMGLNPNGIEISEFAGAIAKKKFGDAVKIADIKDADFENGSFDTITMIDFFEHVADPVPVLKKANRALVSGGLLAILTPNNSSVSSKCMGSAWPHLKEEHIYYYSPEAIKHLLYKIGFNIENICPFPKPLTLFYAKSILRHSGNKLVRLLSNIVYAITPDKLKTVSFRMPMGEMLIIARKAAHV